MNKSLMKELENVERIVKGFSDAREPEKNKLTTIMPPGVAMTYSHSDAGFNTSKEIVRFCTSDHPNVAGYHLGWKETEATHGKRAGEPRRSMWVAHKDAAVLERIAKRRASKFQAWRERAVQKRIDRKAEKTGKASSPTNVTGFPVETEPESIGKAAKKVVAKVAKKTAAKPKGVRKVTPSKTVISRLKKK